MTPTEMFIQRLVELQQGTLTQLRHAAYRGLDAFSETFDIFTGLWWPLREKDLRAPRRAVAWLVAKIYPCTPLPHTPGATLARVLATTAPGGQECRKRQARFDQLLRSSLDQIEPHLRWALATIARNAQPPAGIDWVRLVDDLSDWEAPRIRLRWAQEFLDALSWRDSHVDRNPHDPESQPSQPQP